MKKILLVLLIIIVCGCNNKSVVKDDSVNSISSINILINNETYVLNLDNNNTVNELVNMLPLDLTMNDLNSNEKYGYLDKHLPTNEYKPSTINKGAVMLFGDDCLVIFYKTFDTTYSYTKIGHIDNLPDMGSDSVVVSFNK